MSPPPTPPAALPSPTAGHVQRPLPFSRPSGRTSCLGGGAAGPGVAGPGSDSAAHRGAEVRAWGGVLEVSRVDVGDGENPGDLGEGPGLFHPCSLPDELFTLGERGSGARPRDIPGIPNVRPMGRTLLSLSSSSLQLQIPGPAPARTLPGPRWQCYPHAWPCQHPGWVFGDRMGCGPGQRFRCRGGRGGSPRCGGPPGLGDCTEGPWGEWALVPRVGLEHEERELMHMGLPPACSSSCQGQGETHDRHSRC